jgi:hypothetical protein
VKQGRGRREVYAWGRAGDGWDTTGRLMQEGKKRKRKMGREETNGVGVQRLGVFH